MTKVSVVNNVRYNPDKVPTDIHWARDLSTDQDGSLFRHMLERVVDGKIYEYVPDDIAKKTGIPRVLVRAMIAWRACAALELEIEQLEREQEAPLAGLNARLVEHAPRPSKWTEANKPSPYQACGSEQPGNEPRAPAQAEYDSPVCGCRNVTDCGRPDCH